jgi:hypothetical protein
MDHGTEDRLKAEFRRAFPGLNDTVYEEAVRIYQNARMDGVCHDGAWECAVENLQRRQ